MSSAPTLTRAAYLCDTCVILVSDGGRPHPPTTTQQEVSLLIISAASTSITLSTIRWNIISTRCGSSGLLSFVVVCIIGSGSGNEGNGIIQSPIAIPFSRISSICACDSVFNLCSFRKRMREILFSVNHRSLYLRLLSVYILEYIYTHSIYTLYICVCVCIHSLYRM